jgi:hypothetical protein
VPARDGPSPRAALADLAASLLTRVALTESWAGARLSLQRTASGCIVGGWACGGGEGEGRLSAAVEEGGAAVRGVWRRAGLAGEARVWRRAGLAAPQRRRIHLQVRRPAGLHAYFPMSAARGASPAGRHVRGLEEEGGGLELAGQGDGQEVLRARGGS